MPSDTIRATVKDYILKEFLPGERPEALQDSTPLISGGILDSISTLKLVSFLEQHFAVEFQAHEVNADTLDTIADIERAVSDKVAGR
jgi:acyl carrier protein